MKLVLHSSHPIKTYWKLHEENRNGFYIDHYIFLKFIKYLTIYSTIKKAQVYSLLAPLLDDEEE